MNALKAVVEKTAGTFKGIDEQRNELKRAIAANEQAYKAAEAILDVKSMKHYGRELEEDRGILATMEARRAATIEANSTKLFQQLSQAARSDLEAANDSQEERREKVRSLLQEAGGLLDEIKAEETAAVKQIREYVSAAAPYVKRSEQSLLGSISSSAVFYGLNTQQDAITEALKQF